MGEVDLCDQYRKVLSCSRKSIKWYMRLVWFFIDVCVVNAFILEKKSQTSPKQTQFRIDLANRLHVARKSSGRSHSHPLPTSLMDHHFPELLELRQRCHICMKKNKIEKLTRYYCPECNLGLCPGFCFKLYHTQEKYWL